jgi:hypothetical protein
MRERMKRKSEAKSPALRFVREKYRGEMVRSRCIEVWSRRVPQSA